MLGCLRETRLSSLLGCTPRDNAKVSFKLMEGNDGQGKTAVGLDEHRISDCSAMATARGRAISLFKIILLKIFWSHSALKPGCKFGIEGAVSRSLVPPISTKALKHVIEFVKIFEYDPPGF